MSSDGATSASMKPVKKAVVVKKRKTLMVMIEVGVVLVDLA